MAGPVGTHPSAEILQALRLGKLDEAQVGTVLEHLESCVACRKVVTVQLGDDFLARLREAHSANPSATQSLADPSRNTLPPSGERAPAVPDLPPELAANHQYEVLRELGRGGMGVVYLARNRLLARQEVLKVVNQEKLERAGGKERFLREIQSAARLSHPNVVTAYAALQLGEMLVFAMEYVEGEDLAKVVKAHGPLPVANACYYAQQVALGLQHAHDKTMVHRDIKPQNLILAREGKKHVVKILDFGLAKVLREKAEESALTAAGKMLGTPEYIAPEQSLDAAHADIRADLYSLGCTLYYLLTGSPPFRRKSSFATMQAHHTEEATALHQVRSEVPETLAAVVAKMMAKDPGQRYQKPVEVARALAPFLQTAVKGSAAPSQDMPGADAKQAASAPLVTAKEQGSAIRKNVVIALGKIGPKAKAAAPALVKLLLIAKDREQRVQIVTALGELGKAARDAVPDMIQAFADEKLDTELAETIQAKNVGALNSALNKLDKEFQDKNVEALNKIGPGAVPALIKGLEDKSPLVRWGSIKTLARLGPEAKAAAPALSLNAQREPIPEIQKEAAAARQIVLA